MERTSRHQICALSRAYLLQMQSQMSLACVAISPWAGKSFPSASVPLPDVLLGGQITPTSVALVMALVVKQAVSAEAGTLIRTAALGRFPRRQRGDRAGRTCVGRRVRNTRATLTRWLFKAPLLSDRQLTSWETISFCWWNQKGLKGLKSDWIHWPTH